MRRHALPRLSRVPAFSDSEQRAKDDLVALLTRGDGEDLLRKHVRKGDVKVAEHLIRLVRRDRAIAYRVGCLLIATFGLEATEVKAAKQSARATILREFEIEASENPREARWLVGDLDSCEKAELMEDVNDHIAALTACRDILAVELYGGQS